VNGRKDSKGDARVLSGPSTVPGVHVKGEIY
jgi:hypothetical protein